MGVWKMQFDHRGIIKRILKDHFDGFWRMNEEAFPAQYRQDILETVQKALRCGKKLQIKPGIITVIHTFGRDLKFKKFQLISLENLW